MHALSIFNLIVAIIFTICYMYQMVYIPLVWLLEKKRSVYKLPFKANSFAVMICARNESTVIGDLIDSINGQTYDSRLIHIFVIADNCTDDTAEVARSHGATVYIRNNKAQVGKGYALDYLLKKINSDYPEGFDGYMVFDADNILSPNYIEEMNKTFSQGYEIVTGYRNSKNFGSNWISMGYAVWFMRESRYLNGARYLLHTSCAIGGTGFVFSRNIYNELLGWPFHMLTEDIEFSAYQISKGRQIAFCKTAELYDEQPVRFSQSWSQRLRWAKGFLQVVEGYWGKLFTGIFKYGFSCFDMAMNIMPALILSVISIGVNCLYGIYSGIRYENLWFALSPILATALRLMIPLFIIGLITVITEWKHIQSSIPKKLLSILAFPVFMLTYLPIGIESLFAQTTWKPIDHTVTAKSMQKNITYHHV